MGILHTAIQFRNYHGRITVLAFIASLMGGCHGIDERSIKHQNCSSEWYELIDTQISTGDNQGHGPDVGSLEWRSVIEFKLGIRGDSNVPPLDSEQWCHYINKHYVLRN